MSDQLNMTDEIDELRTLLLADPQVWQNDLLKPEKLWKLANDKGIRVLNHKAISGLWSAGFIRADVVVSSKKIAESFGLTLALQEDQTYYYLDQRRLRHREDGYGSCLSNYKPDPDIEVLFHPYRLYPLYHVVRAFDSSPHSKQYLSYSHGLGKVATFNLEHLDQWTSTTKFCERFDFWNQISELAIVAVAFFYLALILKLRIFLTKN